MRWLRVGVLLTVVLASGCVSTQMSTAESKHALAKELVNNARIAELLSKTSAQLLPQTLATIRQNNPKMTNEAFDQLKQITLTEVQVILPEIIDATVTVYETDFDEEELRELTRFYRTPVGREIMEKVPKMALQLQTLGTAFGKKLVEHITTRLIEEARKKNLAS
jgi:hypothetical protein